MKHEKLKKFLQSEGISLSILSNHLGLCIKTVWSKLDGRTEFTYSEVIKICRLCKFENPRDWFSE